MNLKELTQGQKIQWQDALRKVNLLALVLNFEKYWQSYSLSDGVLYAKQVREEAHKIIPLFYEVFENKAIVEPDGRVNEVDLFESRRFIWELEKWLDTEDKFPKILFDREYTNSSQFVFQYVFMELESQLQNEIGLPVELSFAIMPHENYFRRKQLKWAGQFPDDLLERAMEPSFIIERKGYICKILLQSFRRSGSLLRALLPCSLCCSQNRKPTARKATSYQKLSRT